VFACGAVFWWAVRSGQFDDLEDPGYRILFDDEKPGWIDQPHPVDLDQNTRN